MHGLPGEFVYVRCRHCGLVYQNPQLTPDELAPFYPGDYGAHREGGRRRIPVLGFLDKDTRIESRCRAVMRYASGGRVLDVGCATGTFLEGMRRRGWEVRGVEPSARAAALCRQKLGLEVQASTLDAAQLESASFNLVTMWNVLEHVNDPQQTLRRVHDVLRPGGLLVAAVPNTESLDIRVFGRYWAGYDVPRHLFVFTPENLTRMVEAAGLEVISRRCVSGTYRAFAFNLRFLMRDRVRNRYLCAAATRLVVARPTRLLLMPLSRLLDMLGRGTITTWVCRKKLR